jgi:hypothetical protein
VTLRARERKEEDARAASMADTRACGDCGLHVSGVAGYSESSSDK